MTAVRWRFLLGGLLICLVAKTCWQAYSFPLWECEQLYLEQAEAFLNSRVHIEVRDIDTVYFDGHRYAPYPPAPGLIYIPFVALFGKDPLVAYVACSLLTIVNVFVFNAIGCRLGITASGRWWLTLAFFFGTGYWFCLIYSYSAAYNSHIFVVTFFLLAILETQGRARGWIMGLLLGVLCSTRPVTVFAFPFLVTALWCKHRKSESSTRFLAQLFALCATAFPFLVLILLFNHARFGNYFETGYSLTGGFKRQPYGLFSPVFIPRNLYLLLLKGFTLTVNLNDPRQFSVSPLGTSLVHASPYLLLVLFARLRNPLVLAAWMSIIPAVIFISMLYYAGSHQYNCMRYAFDYLPLLFFVAMIGFKDREGQSDMRIWKVLVCWAVSLNLLCFAILPIVNPWLPTFLSYFAR